MTRQLAILVPVLDRPHRVRPLLASIADATPSAHVVFITEAGDHAEQHEIQDVAPGFIKQGLAVTETRKAGNYAQKINEAVRLTDEPLLFLGADDLDFHTGWFEAARRHLGATVGVVGTNDLGLPRVIRGEHSTHSLVTREYTRLGTIDDLDKLLHEGYLHEWVDDEFIATAQHRGAYAHAHDAIVEHLHPNWGKAPMDNLYAAQRQRIRAGRKIFRERQRLWT